jgi:hypothetical protein
VGRIGGMDTPSVIGHYASSRNAGSI